MNKTVDYKETVSVNQRYSTDSRNKDIIVRSLKQPNCVNVNIVNGIIEFDIEKELGVEIVGDTKVKIAIEEDEEPWDIIADDEYTDEIDKEISENIKEDFIQGE